MSGRAEPVCVTAEGLSLEIDLAPAAATLAGGLAARIATAIGAAHRAAGGEAGELTVLIDDDARIRALNREWRGYDTPTNVLSFPAAPTPGAPGARYLGDIALSYETCAREAAAEGKAFTDHLAHLVVHGYLHVIGYDHGTDAEAEAMEALERRILATIGIRDPYIAQGAAG